MFSSGVVCVHCIVVVVERVVGALAVQDAGGCDNRTALHCTALEFTLLDSTHVDSNTYPKLLFTPKVLP